MHRVMGLRGGGEQGRLWWYKKIARAMAWCKRPLQDNDISEQCISVMRIFGI